MILSGSSPAFGALLSVMAAPANIAFRRSKPRMPNVAAYSRSVAPTRAGRTRRLRLSALRLVASRASARRGLGRVSGRVPQRRRPNAPRRVLRAARRGHPRHGRRRLAAVARGRRAAAAPSHPPVLGGQRGLRSTLRHSPVLPCVVARGLAPAQPEVSAPGLVVRLVGVYRVPGLPAVRSPSASAALSHGAPPSAKTNGGLLRARLTVRTLRSQHG